MNIGQQIEGQIFEQLLPIHGEELTITRGVGAEAAAATIDALVRRPEEMTDQDKRNVNFSLRESSIIQVKKTAITPAIAVGETLVDEDGKNHRVQKILPAPNFVKLVCKTS